MNPKVELLAQGKMDTNRPNAKLGYPAMNTVRETTEYLASKTAKETAVTHVMSEPGEVCGVWRAVALHYGVATVLCAVFSAIYESLSHGVISWWMVGLAAYPLLLGVVPAFVGMRYVLRMNPMARQIWACGVMTLAMGSCLRGVLEIYGTSSSLVAPYIPMGLALLALAVLSHRWARA